MCTCAREVVEVKEQPVRVSSLLLPEPFTWPQGLNLGCQAWPQAPVPAKQSCITLRTVEFSFNTNSLNMHLETLLLWFEYALFP